MNKQPIGVFDSGLGGLSAVREIRRILPTEDIVYFGDTARIPYGTRSAQTVKRYAVSDVRFLCTKCPKAIVIACGTVSANALEECRAAFPGPVIGVIDPACRAAAEATKTGKIGVIATSSTVGSGAYERALHALDASFAVTAQACPLFVPLVENGFTSPDDPVPVEVARRYLEPIRDAGCDVLILGCTHYPLLRDVIRKVLPGVVLIDTGAEVARELASEIGAHSLANTDGGSVSFYVSDDADGFARSAETFLGGFAEDPVECVDVTAY